MKNMMEEMLQTLGTYLPSLVAALAVLIVGWIAAIVVAGVLRSILRKVELNRRVSNWTGAPAEEAPDLENSISKGTFYLTMLFVLVAFFQILRITHITEPLTSLLNQVFLFVPQFVGAVLLLVAAWVTAKLCQIGVRKLLTTGNFDERIARAMGKKEEAGMKEVSLAATIADVVYGVVFLLFLPAILDTLALQGLLTPVQGMIDKILGFLPNLFTAAALVLVGWFLARIVRQIAANLLVAIGTDTFSEKIGLAPVLGDQKLSSILGTIFYILMLIPVAIAGLNTLRLDSITGPASNMLDMLLSSLPNIFAACLVIAIGAAIGKAVSGMVANLLAGAGFDSLIARMGIKQEEKEGAMSPSRLVGYLTMLAIIFFSALEACELLGFSSLAALLNRFMVLSGHVLFGVVIFAVGMLVANAVHKLVAGSGMEKAELMAATARGAVLIFAGAMALRQMGLANEIINMAFGLLLGAIALATAIAFGLGARDIAGRELDGWIASFKSKSK